MRLIQRYPRSKLCTIGLLGSLVMQPAEAVTLDFNAVLVNGTCSLNLDKSVLPLGSVSYQQLKPGVLLSAQPFTLTVDSCQESSVSTLRPIVTVTGHGVLQDNKWLFRESGSSNGAGVVVVQSDVVPVYSNKEIQTNTQVVLSGNGQMLENTKINFYAGVSCGGNLGCAKVATGNVTATLIFNFAYQ